MRQRGFTLLELLVAMAIFAVLGVLTVGGINAVLGQRQIVGKSLDRLERLQRLSRMLVEDFSQLSQRPVRDELGRSIELPLLADGTGTYIVRLSREGWRNPAGLARGTIQRIQYQLEDGKLVREFWPMLDRAQDSSSRKVELIDGVKELQLEFLDGRNEWQTAWPPVSGGTLDWPRAVRIRLTLDDYGEIERLVEIPG